MVYFITWKSRKVPQKNLSIPNGVWNMRILFEFAFGTTKDTFEKWLSKRSKRIFPSDDNNQFCHDDYIWFYRVCVYLVQQFNNPLGKPAISIDVGDRECWWQGQPFLSPMSYLGQNRLNIKVTVMSEVILINISSILILFKVTEKDRNIKNLISIVLILLSVLLNIFALIPSYNLK